MSDRYEGDYPTVQPKAKVDPNFEPPKQHLIRNIMMDKPVTVNPDDDIMKVVQILLKKKITGVPVVNQNEEIVGIVSEKDIFKLILNGAFHPGPTGKVVEYMTEDVTCVSPEQDVFFLANLFYNHHFRRVPVVENKKVVGVISRKDVLKVIQELGA